MTDDEYNLEQCSQNEANLEIFTAQKYFNQAVNTDDDSSDEDSSN